MTPPPAAPTLPARVFASDGAASADASDLPLVCLHGFLGTKDDWADLAARLPARRIVALDLPGHGGATALPDAAYTFDGAVAAVAATLDTLGIGTCDLLGYSMGGRVALAAALAAPGRVRRLVLESASPGLPSDAERAARRAADAARADALRADLGGFLDAWYAQPLFATLTPLLRAGLVARRRAADAGELARGLVGMGTGAMPDLWPRLSALACPTRLIAGGRDAKFAALAARMAAHLPAATVRIVDEAGHNVHLEQPVRFAALVAEG